MEKSNKEISLLYHTQFGFWCVH